MMHDLSKLIEWLADRSIDWFIDSKIDYVSSLQSRRHFGRRVLSIISVNISAAIFDFTAAEGWVEK